MTTMEIEYELIRSKRKTMSITVKDGRLIVRAPLNLKKSEIENFLDKHTGWIEKQLKKSKEMQDTLDSVPALSIEDIKELADEALKVIPDRVRFYAEKMGVTYGRITIRNQKSKWGSCTAKGNLNFNCLLMLAPSEVLDGVIVHELAHRKHMDHSAEFYEEILKVYPNYKKWDMWLKENGTLLIKRMLRSFDY